MTGDVRLLHGDCLDVLRSDALGYPHALGYHPPLIPDASVDAIVTDPPYGLADHHPRTVAAALAAWLAGDREHVPDGRGFMGREWDRFVPPPAVWDECLRVLKPGGWLFAFAGSRTADLMGMSVRLAGFEIRDGIAWHYGSGFPKSLNVNKDARFCQCDRREWPYGDGGLLGVRQGLPGVPADAAAGEGADLLAPVQRQGARPGLGQARPQGAGGEAHAAGAPIRAGQPGVEGRGDLQAGEGQLRRPGVRPLPGGVPVDGPGRRVRDGAPVGDGPADRSAAAAVRGGQPHRPQPAEQRAGEPGAVPVQRGPQAGRGWPVCGGCGKPSIPAGLGTALKPATEPIVVARKPLAGTVAATVLAYGTGALNIDACRVAANGRPLRTKLHGPDTAGTATYGSGLSPRSRAEGTTDAGRWPANVVLSHVPLLDDACPDCEPIGDACAEGCVEGCPVAELDAQSGTSVSTAHGRGERHRGIYGNGAGLMGPAGVRGLTDAGGASRFFPVFRYQAKAPTRERPKVGGVAHPTVKPVDLMRWLVRLVCPPGGVVLDPFAGSGTTGEACRVEGFACVLIEREADYLPLIESRIARHAQAVLL